MIDPYFDNIYVICSVFTIAFILLKRIAYLTYIDDYKGFAFAQSWYYWTEICFVLIWVVVTPRHTYNEGICTILICMVIKLFASKMAWFDKIILRLLKK